MLIAHCLNKQGYLKLYINAKALRECEKIREQKKQLFNF